jgi:hypothetical protein
MVLAACGLSCKIVSAVDVFVAGIVRHYRSHRCHLCERQNDERLASIAPDKRPEKSGETSGGKTLRVGSVLFVSYMKPIPTAHIAYVR